MVGRRVSRHTFILFLSFIFGIVAICLFIVDFLPQLIFPLGLLGLILAIVIAKRIGLKNNIDWFLYIWGSLINLVIVGSYILFYGGLFLSMGLAILLGG